MTVPAFNSVIDAARIVAQRRGWPRSWLNEGATVYMPAPTSATVSVADTPDCSSHRRVFAEADQR